MFTSSIFVAVSALAALTQAQYLPNAVFDGQNYSVSGPIAVVPSSVDAGNSSAWCLAQRNSCPQICGSLATNNTCDTATLTYNCTCANGNQPNISDYQQTLPAQICGRWFQDCIAAHPNDLSGQDGCKALKCGNKTINAATTSSSSSAATTSTGGAGAASSTPATTSATSTSHGAAVAATAFAIAQQYGTPLMAGGMVALFGFAL